jgi:hypothetical protein
MHGYEPVLELVVCRSTGNCAVVGLAALSMSPSLGLQECRYGFSMCYCVRPSSLFTLHHSVDIEPGNLVWRSMESWWRRRFNTKPRRLRTPATFGTFVFIRGLIWRGKLPLYVTLNPPASFCQETVFGQTPALLVYLRATLTNTGNGDGLLMYAYPRGTTSLTHFFEPIALPPQTAAIDVDLQFFCTLPPRHLKDPYSATFVFVDAGGHTHRQRLSLKLQPKAVSAAPKPANTAQEKKPVVNPTPR